MFLFGRPQIRASLCLFLETLFSAILGVPGARVTPGPLPPEPTPTRAGGPGSPARPIRARSRPPCRFLPASSPRAGPRPGVGGVGLRPLGSWSLLCSRRAPPRPAGGGRRGTEAALGRPWAGGASAPSPGFCRLLLPGWVFGLPVARRSGPASLSTGLSASSALTFAGPGLFAHLGLGEDPQQALELGQCSALNAAPFAAKS